MFALSGNGANVQEPRRARRSQEELPYLWVSGVIGAVSLGAAAVHNGRVHAFLTITAGQQAGASLPLDPAKKTRIGRGAECTLMLTDALCSRVHAVISYDEQAWRVCDAQSRNGTFLDGQKVEQAALVDGHRLRVGSTEFVFHESDQPPTLGPLIGPKITQTLIKDTRVGQPTGNSVALAAAADSDQARELLLLYQLSLRALGSRDAHELMRVALDVLRERTGASAVGYLESDEGVLIPKLVVPENPAAPLALSEPLTRLVCEEGHAVWIANQQAAADDVRHHADALCVPLIGVPTNEQRPSPATLGALYVYLEQGRFRQSHFDFAISVANVAALMLARLRDEQRLRAETERSAAAAPDRAVAFESLRLDEWEQHLIREALSRAGGSVPEAARLLGLSRATLYRKLEEYDIGR